jgi:hypothetical protein
VAAVTTPEPWQWDPGHLTGFAIEVFSHGNSRLLMVPVADARRMVRAGTHYLVSANAIMTVDATVDTSCRICLQNSPGTQLG